jgi:hypothetical protein
VRNGSFSTTESPIALKAGERESVLQVFEFCGRDEDRGRDTTIRQGDVLVLGSPTGEISELAPRFSDGICS